MVSSDEKSLFSCGCCAFTPAFHIYVFVKGIMLVLCVHCSAFYSETRECLILSFIPFFYFGGRVQF